MLHAAYKENLKILEDTLCSMCGYSYVFGTYSAVNVTNGESVTKEGTTVTVPYTYTGSDVSQISVMITDKAHGNENAQILYYGALQDVKNAANYLRESFATRTYKNESRIGFGSEAV